MESKKMQEFFKTVTQTEKMMKEIKQRIITNAIMLNYELWQAVDGYENYEISTFGRVKRFYKNGNVKLIKLFKNNWGYYFVRLSKNDKPKKEYIHRLVAKTFIPNTNNKQFVDHIDNSKTNNNINNLRWCTKKENAINTPLQSNNTSGYKGVSFYKGEKKWYAEIKVNGKKKVLGCFKNIEEAIEARQEASKKYFGEFQNACEQ